MRAFNWPADAVENIRVSHWFYRKLWCCLWATWLDCSPRDLANALKIDRLVLVFVPERFHVISIIQLDVLERTEQLVHNNHFYIYGASSRMIIRLHTVVVDELVFISSNCDDQIKVFELFMMFECQTFAGLLLKFGDLLLFPVSCHIDLICLGFGLLVERIKSFQDITFL